MFYREGGMEEAGSKQDGIGGPVLTGRQSGDVGALL